MGALAHPHLSGAQREAFAGAGDRSAGRAALRLVTKVVSASTGILLASCDRSVACFARTSISARFAFHCSRQLKIEGAFSECVLLETRSGPSLGVKRS